MKKVLLLISLFIPAFILSVSAQVTLDNISYEEDKEILITATASGEYSEYGIIVCEDETNLNPSDRDGVKYKALSGKNEEGKFAIALTDKNTQADTLFGVRAYGILNGSVVLSDEVLSVDKEKYYGRIPLLSEASVSEGELFPSFSPGIFDYTVILSELPEKLPDLTYQKEITGDKASVKTAGSKTTIALSTGYEKSVYTFNFRMKNSYTVKPSSFMTKTNKQSSAISGAEFNIYKDTVGYGEGYVYFSDANTPENIELTKAVLRLKAKGTGNVTISHLGEAYWYEKADGYYASTYMPQKDAELGSFTPDSEEYKSYEIPLSVDGINKLSLAFASSGNTDIIPEGLYIEFVRDEELPLRTKDKSTALLAGLSVEGACEIYPSFDKNVNEYYALFNELPETLPGITVIPEGDNASASVEKTDKYVITVTSEDGVSKETYVVNLKEYKTARMKNEHLGIKRSPYEISYVTALRSNATPYAPYAGRVSNYYETDYSHLTTMDFDTAGITGDIQITGLRLNIFATSSCSEGNYIEFYRAPRTDWTDTDAGKYYYATANRVVARGPEGRLNEETLIKRVYASYLSPNYYRYYSIPLKTEGFTNADSVSLFYLTKWQTINPPIGDQYIYIWQGKSGSETYQNQGMLPEIEMKYFEY